MLDITIYIFILFGVGDSIILSPALFKRFKTYVKQLVKIETIKTINNINFKVMKTQIEQKLQKLPYALKVNKVKYNLNITKNNFWWRVEYKNDGRGILFIIEHKNLQAAVDKALSKSHFYQNDFFK